MAAQLGDQNERNFLLLHRLVLDSTRVLRAKFDSCVPPSTFKTWLPRDNDLKKAKLSEAQIQHIKRNPDSGQFDISLLISLLRHFCYKSDLKHPLWNDTDNNKILPSLTCDIANIVRIRNLRNNVCVLTLLLIVCLIVWSSFYRIRTCSKCLLKNEHYTKYHSAKHVGLPFKMLAYTLIIKCKFKIKKKCILRNELWISASGGSWISTGGGGA